jgi:hypothetical protein
MINKELVDLIEVLKPEMYDILGRKLNRITSEFKMRLKEVLDERTRRGEIKGASVNYGCSDCVLHELNQLVPYIETKYKELYASVYPAVEDITDAPVMLQMIPDYYVDEEIRKQIPLQDAPIKAPRKKK